MINGESVLAIIPARSGSKRLPDKNIRSLGGRPLLAYSILTARANTLIDRTVVSSNSQTILNIAEKWGAESVLRPASLATDESPTLDTLRHTLEHCESEGLRYDWVCLLQPNVPFRWVADCERAIRTCSDAKADGALTVDEMFLKTGSVKDGWFVPDYKEGIRKQDLRPSYRENGVFYVLSAANIRQGKLFGPKMLPLVWPAEQSICNIDYEEDFRLAELIFEPFGYGKMFQGLGYALY